MPKKTSKISSGVTNENLQSAILESIAESLGLTVNDSKIDLSSIGFSDWTISVKVQNYLVSLELDNGMGKAILEDNRPSSDYRSSGYITTIGFKDQTGDAILVSIANAQDEWHVKDGCVIMFFIAKDVLGNDFCGLGDSHIKHVMCESKHVYNYDFPEDQIINSNRMLSLCLMANYATYDIPVAKTLMSPTAMYFSAEDTEKRGMIVFVGGERYAIWDVLSSEGLINQICPVISF